MKTSVTLFYTFRLWKHILSQTFTFDLFTPFLTLQSLPRLWALYVVTEVSSLNFLSNVSLFMFRLTSYLCICQTTCVRRILPLVIEYLSVKGYLINNFFILMSFTVPQLRLVKWCLLKEYFICKKLIQITHYL